MRFVKESDLIEADFCEFERNRMYPPGYGKETETMKPKMKHVYAITRSQNLLKSGVDDVLEKRFHKAIERDLMLMTEVKTMLLSMIENPTLPFVETVEKGVDKTGLPNAY